MYYLPYNKDLKQFSRDLRNHSTYGEVLLWMELRASQLKGYKVNRQKPLDKYIVDFYCKRLNLVIEVDGESHYSEEARLKDEKRQQVLENLGLRFLRFDDWDVKIKWKQFFKRLWSLWMSLREQIPPHLLIPLPPLAKGDIHSKL